MKEKYERSTVQSTNMAVQHANALVSQAAQALKDSIPEKEYLGTLCLHFYAGTNLTTAENKITLVTQRVDLEINPDVAGMMMPEIRDRVFEALGGKQMALKPKTVEETLDLGETVIKTSLDS